MSTHKAISYSGKLDSLKDPKVLGILNATPDSFYSASRKEEEAAGRTHIKNMVAQGAWGIDIGGASSRPGADILSPEQEWSRIADLVYWTRETYPDIVLSVDTYHAFVAKKALHVGAQMINDVSGGTYDPDMIPLIVEYNPIYVMGHMPGNPQTMMNWKAPEDILVFLSQYFSGRIGKMRASGCSNLMIDPCFGFGKTVKENYNILRHLEVFQYLETPVMVGLSRKSMFTKRFGISAQEALPATSVAHLLALQRGAGILRVHDVKEALQTCDLWKEMQRR